MKRINFIIICLVTISLFSCKKDDVISSLKMTVEGTVLETNTNSFISGATVVLNTDGKTYTTTTDDNGFFTLGSFSTGSYTVVVSKTDYLTTTVSITSDNETITDYTENVVVNKVCYLAPLHASLNITVYKYFYNESYDVRQTANSKPYNLYINNKNVSSGTTDENGMLSADKLPVNTYVYIQFDFEEDGIRYKTYTNFYTGNTSTNSLTIYGYYSGGDLGVVTTNITNSYGDGIKDFSASGDIELSFNMPIDTASTGFELYNSDASTYSNYTEVWSNSNMKVTISPESDLVAGAKYQFHVYVNDEKNYQNISKYIYFEIAE